MVGIVVVVGLTIGCIREIRGVIWKNVILKYNDLFNDLFVTPGLSGIVIALMGNRPFEGRLWIFKILRDKPWEWREVKLFNRSIEMQTNFIQE